MSRLVLLVAAALAASAAAPLDFLVAAAAADAFDVDLQKLCKECPVLINLFLNNKQIEERAFDGLCAKLLNADDSNPILVCEAGLMGELEHFKDDLKDGNVTPKQICQKLRICPAK
ncbi:hypothetical protein PFISCL1PPCAC_21827 [Pristionchus fissidentatus]|uniref:Saposin B-type domain-containing protein n=1 Tax=Pristionchus fissidentatus TaxID=1538716 RepID=A0AAV5WFT2_9BILA|nr:hypothetical protein PFISCL1PPCAC_21827 [Pristionchus fissidentatus]